MSNILRQTTEREISGVAGAAEVHDGQVRGLGDEGVGHDGEVGDGQQNDTSS